MYVVHGLYRRVPRTVSLDMLVQIAAIVDYYDCHEVLELSVEMWLQNLEGQLPTGPDRSLFQWLYASYVFRRADIFEKSTKIAVEQTRGKLPTSSVPIAHVFGK